MRIVRLIIFGFLFFSSPVIAQDCTGPSGQYGEILFNRDNDVFQGCTQGAGWVALHEATGYSSPPSSPTNCSNIGDTCDDGSIYAGLSPDGNVAMYTTPADAPGSYTWNDGSSNWVDTAMENCVSYSPGAQASCRTGEANAALLVGLSGSGTPAPYDAAEYCDGLSAHGYSDWYLPALDELNVLYENLVDQNGDNTPGGPLGSTYGFNTSGMSAYWASSEVNNQYAGAQMFDSGFQSSGEKSYSMVLVRCVRK